jgi:hypothetical protein
MCSSWTPDGLYFAGARIADLDAPLGVPATALGGHQTVRVLGTADVDGPEYLSSYDAVSDDPTVLVVSAEDGGPIDVQGVGEGSAYLRLLQPGTNLLLDRVRLQVAAVARVELAPRPWWFRSPGRWALWASSPVDVAAHLRDASDHIVVDEGTTITGADVTQTLAWDEIEVVAPAAGTTTIHVEAAGTATDIDIPVVDHLDSVGSSDTDTEVMVGETATFCFEARTDGALVAGVEMTFTVSGDASEASESTLVPACVSITGSAPGSATITATAAGVTGTLDLTIVPPPDTGSMSAPLVEASGAAPGERAGSLDAR